MDRTIPSGSMPLGVVLFMFGDARPFLLLGVDGVDGFFLFLAPFLPPLAFADIRTLCLFPIVAVSSSLVSSDRLFQYPLFRSSII